MKFVIYKATNNINGKVYIGQTRNWPSRVIQHNACKDGKLFHKAIAKYGRENFSWEVLYELETDNLNCGVHWMNAVEIAAVTLNHTYSVQYPERGYNLTMGGDGTIGSKGPIGESNGMKRHDVVEKMKETCRNTGVYEEWSKRMKENNPMRRKEVAAKASNTRKGKYVGEDNPNYGNHWHATEEQKERYRQGAAKRMAAGTQGSSKGKHWTLTDEQKAKHSMPRELNPMYGKIPWNKGKKVGIVTRQGKQPKYKWLLPDGSIRIMAKCRYVGKDWINSGEV